MRLTRSSATPSSSQWGRNSWRRHLAARFRVPSGSRSRRQIFSDGLSHLDVARHPDKRISLQRLPEQRLRSFAIAWDAAVPQHHRLEAAYLSLFEAIGKEISLPACE